MIEVVAISRKVLTRLSTMNFELGGGGFTEQLIFPKKIQRDGAKFLNRISEQELRHMFIEEFKNSHREFFYSIETPTIEKYRFKELSEDKKNLKQSALHDMCVYEREGGNLNRKLNIEFKHKTAFKSIEKDIIKLLIEQQDGAFILLLQNTNRATLISVLKKLSDCFTTHIDSWKGNKAKIIEIIILSLEKTKKQNKTPFLIHYKITQTDLVNLDLSNKMKKQIDSLENNKINTSTL